MNDVLAFVAGQQQALVAVCAPRQPNLGLMEKAEVREKLIPPPRPGRWVNFRLSEYQLRQHNISSPRTPAQKLDADGFLPLPAAGRAGLSWISCP